MEETWGHPSAAASSPQRRIKAFIIEDEPIAARLYSGLLASFCSPNQVHLQTFTDGDAAWAELTKVDPDILITDLLHPGLDGEEILNLLAAEKVDYPILLIADDSLPADFYKTCYPELKLGTIGKPFQVSTFYAHLSRWLPGREDLVFANPA